MDYAFWQDSWDSGGFKTSFHRPDVHPYVKIWLDAAAVQDATVLVPLCGKSVDLLHLAAYAKQVIGVEVVRSAIDEFMADNDIAMERRSPDRYVYRNLTILHRDFFALEPDEIGAVDWVYDRASLVALPTVMRSDYLAAIERLTQPGTRTLLITLEYAPELVSAPFSIAPCEVDDYYRHSHDIRHMAGPLLPEHGMMRAWKLDYLYEHGFLLTRRSNSYHTV